MLRTQFTPLMLSGLNVWFDAADTNSMYDATSGGNLVADGSTVARWQDKSGNGRHATQATSANRPTLNSNKQNGLPSLTFDSTNDSMATGTFAHSQPLTLFVARRATSASQIGYARIVEHGSNNGVALVHDFASPQPFGIQYATTAINNTGLNGTVPYIIEAYVDSSATRNVYVDVNGTNKVTTTRTGTPTTSSVAFTINNYGGGGSYNCAQEIYEIIYYNRLLSAAERTAVRTYLNTKWKAY